MSFPESLNLVKILVEKELRSFFQNKSVEARKLHPATLGLVNQAADLTLRAGKRTRAFLCWLGYSTVVPAKAGIHKRIPDRVGDDKLLCAMMALELFQTFALIHDDVIDEDEERRGGPTVHQYFASHVSLRLRLGQARFTCRDPRHFGESLAILAGDLALVWANEFIKLTGSEKAQALFNQMSEETILGQTLDVLRTQAGENISKSKIDELKTAYYSVVRPLQLGATLAGVNQKLLGQLEQYGLVVGRLFQLRDDFLDQELSAQDFDTKINPLLNQALGLVEELSASELTEGNLRDFTRFVVTRQK